MTLNGDAKSEETLTLWFQIWHEELGELYYSTQTLKNCTLIDYFVKSM